ncbi:hypothetical protein GGX14DRAFT_358907 [Mycena pura]|uniref:Uncharacterized protein n=1 Tax=Mycena pura TaxID=153505 RepID=A0AAD6VQ63_9AGAR|nr:hypothetical protein GGX14DRAFT_358907 [Mycena pura]
MHPCSVRGAFVEGDYISPERQKDLKNVILQYSQRISRRDKSEIYLRYFRLMLIFFKPWRRASDLRNKGQPWVETFEQFSSTCSTSESVRNKMENMQMIHECRDSRDDHFTQRRYLARQAQKDARRAKRGHAESADDFGGEDVTEE